jgi:hypothetical protein
MMQLAEYIEVEKVIVIPSDPETRLTRAETAEALSSLGFKTTKSTLATKAVRGGGPVYQLFGTKPVYRWADALAWAESKLSAPRRNSSDI